MNKYINKIIALAFITSALSSAPTFALSNQIFDPTSAFHVLEAPAQKIKSGAKAVMEHVAANAVIYTTVGLVLGFAVGVTFLMNSPPVRAGMMALGKKLMGGLPGAGMALPNAKEATSYSLMAWIAGKGLRRATQTPAAKMMLDDGSLEMIVMAMEQIARASIQDYNQLFFEAKASEAMPEAHITFMQQAHMREISFEPVDKDWFRMINNRTGQSLMFSNRMPRAGELRGEVLRARLEAQGALNKNQTLYEAILTLARSRDSEIYTYAKNALLQTHLQLTESILDSFAEKILQLIKQGRAPSLEAAKKIFSESL